MCNLKLLLPVLFCPLLLYAQSPGPAFKNDTLYTIGGYRIYKGQVIQFTKGSGKKGKFRFVSIRNGFAENALTGNSILVTGLGHFDINAQEDAHVDITGSVVFKDGTKSTIEIQLVFDKALDNTNGLPAEMMVPAEFINNSKVILYRELKKLLNAYIEGKIDKVTYEAQKKELLEKQ